jgi:hypothetical protein
MNRVPQQRWKRKRPASEHLVVAGLNISGSREAVKWKRVAPGRPNSVPRAENRSGPWVSQLLDSCRRDPRFASISFANSRASKRSSSRSVLALCRRPSRARVCTGSARRTSKPLATSSRHTQRQPVVASIATAATPPRHRSVHLVRPPDQPRSAPRLPHLSRDRAQPPGTRACGCRSPRTTSRPPLVDTKARSS